MPRNYDKILTRLKTIILRLINGEALSVTKLAKEFKVNERTIQRDLNEQLKYFFPLYQDNKRWKMQDEYQLEKNYSPEDIVVLSMLKKHIKDSGEEFSKIAEKLLSVMIQYQTPNAFCMKSDMADDDDKTSKILKLEDYPTIEKVMTTNDGILDTPEAIKSYINEFHIAYMKHVDRSRLALATFENEKYVIREDYPVNTSSYHSAGELIEAGWRASLVPLWDIFKKA